MIRRQYDIPLVNTPALTSLSKRWLVKFPYKATASGSFGFQYFKRISFNYIATNEAGGLEF